MKMKIEKRSQRVVRVAAKVAGAVWFAAFIALAVGSTLLHKSPAAYFAVILGLTALVFGADSIINREAYAEAALRKATTTTEWMSARCDPSFYVMFGVLVALFGTVLTAAGIVLWHTGWFV